MYAPNTFPGQKITHKGHRSLLIDFPLPATSSDRDIFPVHQTGTETFSTCFPLRLGYLPLRLELRVRVLSARFLSLFSLFVVFHLVLPVRPVPAEIFNRARETSGVYEAGTKRIIGAAIC